MPQSHPVYVRRLLSSLSLQLFPRVSAGVLYNLLKRVSWTLLTFRYQLGPR